MTDAPSACRPSLTRNQGLVLDALEQAANPMSAYDLLDALRVHGLRAPPQIYRALEKLQCQGLVHRIESMNAFVACSQPHEHGPDAIVMAICERCSQVTELCDRTLTKHLQSLAGHQSFDTSSATIELHGCCKRCR